MQEINGGLKDLHRIYVKTFPTYQGRLKLIFLGNRAESVIRRIDQRFSLVHHFQQTASDLQSFRDQRDQLVVVLPIDDEDLEYGEENRERDAMLPKAVWPTEVPKGTTQLEDEIRPDKTGEHTFRFPDQMVFESGQNFVLTVKETSPKPDTASADKLFQLEDGHEGLQQCLRGLRDAQDATKEVNIVVCGQATKKDQGAVTMKDEAVLLDVLKTLKVPLTCVHRLLDGIPMLIEHEASSLSTYTSFTFRLPLSQNEDWTLGVYWDHSRQVINAFIHGMQNVERLAFSRKMAAALADIQHPMLLPVILCELLTAGDIASDAEQANEGARVSFSQMTQRLNVAISRLPTREARTKANILLVGRILECISAIANKHCPNEEGDDTRKNEALWKSTNRLKGRLRVLQATQNGLLLEIAREYQIASSQLQIVYNLVAQRDNKNNYEMARISLEISRTAKDDSFAMFALAVMSILFLPGAFIATLFSMDLFDWSAEDGKRVINSRFWTYWAIALPLTLIVLIGWLSWLKMHQKNEDQKRRIFPMAASQQTHLGGPNTRQSAVPQSGNGTASNTRESADVGGGKLSWTRYLRRRKEPETSSLSPRMVLDVEMNNRDGIEY
ncbi:hypothetical protein CDV36_003725 [Fusarium kuroshium]|uniref:Mg2+ transporter protein, CorA-like/Zinc transport protein ZntB n=1 Tax=Fusarium kuroshium TaxID=2010991 RepID=A0A3M2SG71_9HYPO|nr:hypothetical protein CDV36_003725 [Fusarium kuroshium]